MRFSYGIGGEDRMSNSPQIEEQVCWERWSQTQDTEAGNILVKKYMPLVTYHVQRVAVSLPKNVSRDELKSLGMMGLFDAINKFDHTRDLKFDTYASYRIRGAIIDGLRKEDWMPRTLREKVKKIEQISASLEQQLSRHATAEEIADISGYSVDEVHQTINEYLFANVLSIDEQIQDYEDSEKQSHYIKDENILTPEQQIIRTESIEELSVLIDTLNKNEQLVLSLFYKEELTFTEIGKIMELSTSRISQIHSKALFKLKEVLLKNTEQEQ